MAAEPCYSFLEEAALGLGEVAQSNLEQAVAALYLPNEEEERKVFPPRPLTPVPSFAP